MEAEMQIDGEHVFKGTEKDQSKDFFVHLKEAQETDLQDLERTGCVTYGRDLKNNQIIALIPILGLNATEKSEVTFRKMLLLFIRKANEIVGANYSVVYAHTNIDIINQYPLIYKFYSILPRAYKKNLLKMYVIHPNMAIRMFFEFARVFLSQKFYSKLCLLDSILDFQKLIPPTRLSLPLKFLRKEDEVRELKFFGHMASLSFSFDPFIGTTKLIDACVRFLKAQKALQQRGIFRVAGDDSELSLAKIRLQYADQNGDYKDRIMLSENSDYLLIGDISALARKPSKRNTMDRKPKAELTVKSGTIGADVDLLPEEKATSVIVVSNVNTVAQILKMSISHLPEPLVPYECYASLIEATRRSEASGLSQVWERSVTTALSKLPHEHLSTLVFVIKFLREVAAESAYNSMDSSNLAIIFAPSIFRPDMVDPMKAVMEMKLAKIIVKELIDRLSLLQQAMHLYGDRKREEGLVSPKFMFENPIEARNQEVLSGDLALKLNISEVRDITDGFGPKLFNRLHRMRPTNEDSDDDEIDPRISTVENEVSMSTEQREEEEETVRSISSSSSESGCSGSYIANNSTAAKLNIQDNEMKEEESAIITASSSSAKSITTPRIIISAEEVLRQLGRPISSEETNNEPQQHHNLSNQKA